METSEEEFVSDLPDEGSAETGERALRKLREKLKKAVEEKQEYLEGWQRARADLANYKKETAAAHGESQERIKAQLIEAILPALDALELSLQHEQSPTLQMLEKQFLDALKKIGVERYGTAGEDFDPRLHEALAMNGSDHVIQSVARSGYRTGDTIIRPAQVTL